MKILREAGAALIMLFALNVNAQTLVGIPEHGVILTGKPSAPKPMITDSRHKAILAYVVNMIAADGQGNIAVPIDTHNVRHPNNQWDIGIKESTMVGVNVGLVPTHGGMPQKPVRAELLLVVFDNGETVGPDDDSMRFAVLSASIDAERTLAQRVLANPPGIWDELAAMITREAVTQRSASFIESAAKGAREEVARDLQKTRDTEGLAEATEAAKRTAALPHLWRVQ